MKLLFIYRRDLVVCYVYVFLHYKYDFHVDAERMTVKTQEM